MNLKKLSADLRAKQGEIDGIITKMETADEAGKTTLQTEYKAKTAEFEKLSEQIDVAKAHAARQARMAEADTLSEVDFSGKTIPADKVELNARDGDKEEAARENIFMDYFCGKSISDVAHDAMLPKGKNWKKAEAGITLPKRFARALCPEAFHGKALPLVSNATPGSSLYQGDFKPELLMYAPDPGAIFPRCRQVPTSAGSITWPQLTQSAPGAEGTADEANEVGGVICAWTAEGSEAPATEPVIGQVNIPTYELAARTELSRTLVRRSAIDIEALLQTLFRMAIVSKMDFAILNGNGTGKPTGVLKAGLGIGEVERAGADAVSYADLIALETKIAPQLRSGAAWAIADGALQSLKLLVDGNNRPLFSSMLNGAGQQIPLGNLIGYMTMAHQRLALGDEGDVVLGNWTQYICAVEEEMVILRSEHQKMTSGLIVYAIFAQMGGKPVQPRAFAKLIDAA